MDEPNPATFHLRVGDVFWTDGGIKWITTHRAQGLIQAVSQDGKRRFIDAFTGQWTESGEWDGKPEV